MYNPEHEMLALRLGGHVIDMSPWQFIEVQEHLDAELNYVIDHEITEFHDNKSNFRGKAYYVRELFLKVCIAIVDVIQERENYDIRKSYSQSKLDEARQKVLNKMMDAHNVYSGSREHFGTLHGVAGEFLIHAVNAALIQVRALK